MRRLALIAAALAAAPVAAPVAGEDSGQVAAVAADALQRLETAAALLDAAQSSEDRIAALTETVRAYEVGLDGLREGLRRVVDRQRAIEAGLAARREEIARLLGALQVMGRAPPPLLLLHPSGPLGTARSGMILAEVTPGLQAEAEALAAELAELRDLRQIQQGAAEVLEAALDRAQTARAELARAVASRTDPPRRFTEDPDAMAGLLAAADTLAAFAEGLSGTVGTDLAAIVPDATPERGRLPLPVQGTLLRRAGEADSAGIVRPGIILATPPQALVTAPATVTLRYAGRLLDYGNVAILEPAPGVLIVLAGLGTVFGQPGEVLPQGAPVGLMGGTVPGAGATFGDAPALSAPPRPETLYLEVREGQAAVDPAVWFALP